jgi:phage terminase Nu1 subunit (DNA packaging protein)
MFISFADLAKMKGVSRSAVSQKKRAGILNGAIVNVNGKDVLNKDEALRLWETNMVPHVSNLKNVEGDNRKTTNTDEIPDFNTSRSKREAMMARLAEIDVEEREKVLVSAAEVKSSWAQIISLARTKVLGIPSKAKQRIPDLDTSAMTCLEDIVRESLEDLASSELETA